MVKPPSTRRSASRALMPVYWPSAVTVPENVNTSVSPSRRCPVGVRVSAVAAAAVAGVALAGLATRWMGAVGDQTALLALGGLMTFTDVWWALLPAAIMVGAHLDSVAEGPGINDNGSGVAAVLDEGDTVLPPVLVQAAHTRRADVHARALAHRLQAFQDLDAALAVAAFAGLGGLLGLLGVLVFGLLVRIRHLLARWRRARAAHCFENIEAGGSFRRPPACVPVWKPA